MFDVVVNVSMIPVSLAAREILLNIFLFMRNNSLTLESLLLLLLEVFFLSLFALVLWSSGWHVPEDMDVIKYWE